MKLLQIYIAKCSKTLYVLVEQHGNTRKYFTCWQRRLWLTFSEALAITSVVDFNLSETKKPPGVGGFFVFSMAKPSRPV